MDHATLAEYVRVPATWADIPGHFDFPGLYDAVAKAALPDARFVEVGCLAGRSLLYLAAACRAAAAKKRAAPPLIYGVDGTNGTENPEDGAGVGLAAALGGSFAGLLARNVRAAGHSDHVSILVAPSVVAARAFADGSLDFVFLDAAHDRASVAADIAAWRPKLRPAGRMAGHDYRSARFPGVEQAVAEAFGPGDHTCRESPSCWSVDRAGPHAPPVPKVVKSRKRRA